MPLFDHSSGMAASFLQSPDGSGYWAAMKHRHLVLTYVVTWGGQLAYLAWILVRRRRTHISGT